MGDASGQYCPHCGAPDQRGQFCMACGERIREPAGTAEEPDASTNDANEDAFEWIGDSEGTVEEGPAATTGAPDSTESPSPAPTWPLWVLAALVPAWIVGIASYQAGGPLAAVAGLAVVASLPLLYLDATWATEAGELDLDYPIAVPIACLLLWVLAVPAYVAYRFYAR